MSPANDATSLTFTDVSAALQRCAELPGAAEAHGLASGLWVARVHEPAVVWQRELYSELDAGDVLAAECRDVLDRLFAAVFATDAAEGMTYALLLPEGINVDAERVSAVRDWCQGFLFGFGLGGGDLQGRLSKEARELLTDFTEFTRLDTQDVENTQENQSALIEIEEYLRVGVMLLRDELTPTEQHEPD